MYIYSTISWTCNRLCCTDSFVALNPRVVKLLLWNYYYYFKSCWSLLLLLLLLLTVLLLLPVSCGKSITITITHIPITMTLGFLVVVSSCTSISLNMPTNTSNIIAVRWQFKMLHNTCTLFLTLWCCLKFQANSSHCTFPDLGWSILYRRTLKTCKSTIVLHRMHIWMISFTTVFLLCSNVIFNFSRPMSV